MPLHRLLAGILLHGFLQVYSMHLHIYIVFPPSLDAQAGLCADDNSWARRGGTGRGAAGFNFTVSCSHTARAKSLVLSVLSVVLALVPPPRPYSGT